MIKRVEVVIAAAVLFGALHPRNSAANALPLNLAEARLVASDGSLTLTPLQVPYFAGEKLIIRVAVRNLSGSEKSLPPPSVLNVDVDENADPWAFRIHGHQCSRGTSEMVGGPILDAAGRVKEFRFSEVTEGPCIERLKSQRTRFMPEHERAAIWIGETRAHKPSVARKDAASYGVKFSSHGLVGEGYLRVTLHPLPDPVSGQLLKSPIDGRVSYYFVVPTASGKFFVLALGGWQPTVERVPQVFSAANLNELAQVHTVTRYAILDKPPTTIGLDASGNLLIDGHKVQAPHYRGLGWVTVDEARPRDPGPNPSPSDSGSAVQ